MGVSRKCVQAIPPYFDDNVLQPHLARFFLGFCFLECRVRRNAGMGVGWKCVQAIPPYLGGNVLQPYLARFVLGFCFFECRVRRGAAMGWTGSVSGQFPPLWVTMCPSPVWPDLFLVFVFLSVEFVVAQAWGGSEAFAAIPPYLDDNMIQPHLVQLNDGLDVERIYNHFQEAN